jgi:fucose 4-O-acetylase-like acetyltransferase
MKSRNIALDYAKGVGILVVVFAHLFRGLWSAGLLKSVNPDVFAAISSTCTILSMPTFFLVSGLLYGSNMAKRHGLKEFAGKFDAIFYPYVVWSLIVGAFEVFASGWSNHGSTLKDLHDILWTPHGIFWFLYALILAFALVELMIYATNVTWARRAVLPVGIALILVEPWMPHFFALHEICMSFVYFGLGIVLVDHVPKTQKPSWITLGALVAVLLAVEYVAHFHADAGTHSPKAITPNAILTAVVSLFVLMWICYSLPAGLSKLAYLGERSMDIYVTHLLFIAPIRMVLNKFLGVHEVSIYLAVGMAAGIIGPLVVTSYLKKTPLVCLFQPPAFLSLKSRLSMPASTKRADAN